MLGALTGAETIVGLDARSKEELARVAFSIVDRPDIATVTVVLEVDVSVAVEIEGKSSVDEEQIIQR